MTYALVDIGNTSIKAHVYRGNDLRTGMHIPCNEASLSMFLSSPHINQYLISSVVPSINDQIRPLSKGSLTFLTHQHFLDITIDVVPPESVGIDRLVNAVAVQHIWNANALIIDIGTAVTFCRVKKNGHYLGGIIAPGFEMIRRALYQGAEQLPFVDFPTTRPGLVGKSTEEAMAAGLFYGSVKMINGIQHEMKKSDPKMATILTGGIPSLLLSFINHDVYQRDLQFEGLKILHQKFCMV